mmetsp:Transcript_1023/g.3200  ORF Transcript_1023/g.3200 Transcript_1023/m.3200 type:complete len:99 (+) Transcript_1023:1527-1823(+)
MNRCRQTHPRSLPSFSSSLLLYLAPSLHAQLGTSYLLTGLHDTRSGSAFLSCRNATLKSAPLVLSAAASTKPLHSLDVLLLHSATSPGTGKRVPSSFL